jgi:hypothetical protein
MEETATGRRGFLGGLGAMLLWRREEAQFQPNPSSNAWCQPGDTFTFTREGKTRTYIWVKNSFGQPGWQDFEIWYRAQGSKG